MPNKTEHYQLNQYQPEDNFLRTDFNEDNAKLDAALAGKPDREEVAQGLQTKCQVVAGSFMGSFQDKIVDVGFYPVAVYVHLAQGQYHSTGVELGGVATRSQPLMTKRNEGVLAELTQTGFRLNYIASSALSRADSPVNYIAFG